MFDDDKDLDTSLNDDPDIISLSGVTFDTTDITDTVYDNDLAYQIQQTSVPSLKSLPKPTSAKPVTSWMEIVMEAENRPEIMSANKQDLSKDDNKMSHDVGCGPDDALNEALRNMENEILNNQGFDILESNEKHEKESTTETDKKKNSTWETIDVGDKKMNNILRKEIRRDEERELAHSILSPRAPMLMPPGFDPTNIGEYFMKCTLHYVSVLHISA